LSFIYLSVIQYLKQSSEYITRWISLLRDSPGLRISRLATELWETMIFYYKNINLWSVASRMTPRSLDNSCDREDRTAPQIPGQQKPHTSSDFCPNYSSEPPIVSENGFSKLKRRYCSLHEWHLDPSMIPAIERTEWHPEVSANKNNIRVLIWVQITALNSQ
jgi:hypothetical protein